MVERYSDILKDKHFCQFAALFSVTMAPGWRLRHQDVPSVRATIDELARFIRGMESEPIRQKLLSRWIDLIVSLVSADPALRYGPDDMDWFIGVVEGDTSTAKVTLMMLLAMATCRQEWYSIEQISEMTSQAASTWRNKAAAGDVIGAKKAGKTWIFPALALQAYGVNVPTGLTIEEASEDNEE